MAAPGAGSGLLSRSGSENSRLGQRAAPLLLGSPLSSLAFVACLRDLSVAALLPFRLALSGGACSRRALPGLAQPLSGGLAGRCILAGRRILAGRCVLAGRCIIAGWRCRRGRRVLAWLRAARGRCGCPARNRLASCTRRTMRSTAVLIKEVPASLASPPTDTQQTLDERRKDITGRPLNTC